MTLAAWLKGVVPGNVRPVSIVVMLGILVLPGKRGGAPFEIMSTTAVISQPSQEVSVGRIVGNINSLAAQTKILLRTFPSTSPPNSHSSCPEAADSLAMTTYCGRSFHLFLGAFMDRSCLPTWLCQVTCHVKCGDHRFCIVQAHCAAISA